MPLADLPVQVFFGTIQTFKRQNDMRCPLGVQLKLNVFICMNLYYRTNISILTQKEKCNSSKEK